MDFCLLPEIWKKNIGKKISRNLNIKNNQKLLDSAEQSATNPLKLFQKKQFKQHQNLIGNTISDRKKPPHRIIKKQMWKHLEKDIYLQKKDRKLLMI